MLSTSPRAGGGHLRGTDPRVLVAETLVEARPDGIGLADRTYAAEIRARLVTRGLARSVHAA